jgi:hypothetical protein
MEFVLTLVFLEIDLTKITFNRLSLLFNQGWQYATDFHQLGCEKNQLEKKPGGFIKNIGAKV